MIIRDYKVIEKDKRGPKRGPKKGTIYRKRAFKKFIYLKTKRIGITNKFSELLKEEGYTEEILKEMSISQKGALYVSAKVSYNIQLKKYFIRFAKKPYFVSNIKKQENIINFLHEIKDEIGNEIEDKIKNVPILFNRINRLSIKKQEKKTNEIKIRKKIIYLLLEEITNRINYLNGESTFIKDDKETKQKIKDLCSDRFDTHRRYVINNFTKKEQEQKKEKYHNICPGCDRKEKLFLEHGYPTILAYQNYLKTGIKRVYTINDMGFLCKSCNSTKRSNLKWIPPNGKKLDWVDYEDENEPMQEIQVCLFNSGL